MPDAEITRAARTLREFVTALLRASPPSQLSRTAAGTLAALDRLGPLRITQLADREVVSQPAMTGLIQRLEAAQFVVREPDPSDGRAVLIAITASGRAALTKRRSVHDRVLIERIKMLPVEERALLFAALPAIDRLSNFDAPDAS